MRVNLSISMILHCTSPMPPTWPIVPATLAWSSFWWCDAHIHSEVTDYIILFEKALLEGKVSQGSWVGKVPLRQAPGCLPFLGLQGHVEAGHAGFLVEKSLSVCSEMWELGTGKMWFWDVDAADFTAVGKKELMASPQSWCFPSRNAGCSTALFSES